MPLPVPSIVVSPTQTTEASLLLNPRVLWREWVSPLADNLPRVHRTDVPTTKDVGLVRSKLKMRRIHT